jgi:hypothetical protein
LQVLAQQARLQAFKQTFKNQQRLQFARVEPQPRQFIGAAFCGALVVVAAECFVIGDGRVQFFAHQMNHSVYRGFGTFQLCH